MPQQEAIAAPRVAFANAAELDRGAKTLIESLRPGLIQDGYETVPPGALRDAMEAPLAASDDRLARARSLLAAAKDAYAGFQFEDALGDLARVDAALANQPHSEELIDILAERYVLEGLVHAGAKNKARAEAAFAVVKRLHPARRLDPATYHPRIVALFGRAGARPGAEVTVRIDARVGARVMVDNKEVGKAPVELPMVAGIHHVSVDAEGHVPVGKAIDVTPKTTQQTRRLRDELRTAKSTRELQAAADGLCALAKADILVAVRNRNESAFEAAVYRCERRELGEWVPIPSAQFFAALGPAAPASTKSGTNPRLVARPPDDERSGKRGWYRTWWGTGLIAGAAAAVGTAAYFAFRPQDEFVIGGWCVGEECPQ